MSGKSDAVVSIASAKIDFLNDDFDISISVQSGSTVNESAADPEDFVITATLTSAKTSPVTVQLNFGGTASSSEYTIGGTTTITLGAGVLTSTATITIDPADNDLRGGDKTITVSGTIPGSDLNVQAAENSIALVDDEEAPTVTVKVDPSRLNEDVGNASVVVTAELTDGDPLAATATITLKVDPVADMAGMADKDDFSVSGNLDIMIPAGMKSASTTLTVRVVDDPSFENEETITVSSSTDAPIEDNPDNNELTPAIADATITIVDNDYDVSISVDPPSVPENASDPVTVTVTAKLTGTRTSNIDIAVAYAMGTTSLANIVTDGDMITINAGDMSGETEVTIDPSAGTSNLTNETYEGDRSIDITATSFANQLNIQNAKITITDDEEKPTVKLEAAPPSVNEGGGSTTVTITWTLEPNGLTEATTIELETEGTAVREDEVGSDAYLMADYGLGMSPDLTVNVGQNTTTGTHQITITPRDDDEFEATKTIIVSGKSGDVESVASTTIDLINDDYDVVISIPAQADDSEDVNPMMVDEDTEDPVSIVIQAMLTATRTSPVTVQLTFGGTEASRYVVGGTTTITVGAGAMTGTATVTIDPVDNDLRGGDKEIEVSGMVTGSDLNVQASALKITIVDNEPAAVLTLKADPSSISEGAGPTMVTMTAELNVGLEEDDTVEMSVMAYDETTMTGSTADGDGKDYSTTELMDIMIPSGATSASSSFTLTPVDDNEHEDPDQTIVISGSGVGDGGMATITLEGNDYDVRLSASPSEITEGDDATDIVITADLAGGTRSNPVEVLIGIGPGGAGSNRYADNTGMISDQGLHTRDESDGAVNSVTIPAGMTMGTATIEINPADDDNAFSGDQPIHILGTTSDNLNVKATKVTLRDLQRAMVTISTDVDTLMEAGALPTDVMVTATLSSLLPTATEVELTKTGSAEKGVDYMVGAPEGGTITIPAGQSEATIPLVLTPVDDFTAEGEDGTEMIDIGGNATGGLRVTGTSIALIDNNLLPLASVMVEPLTINEDGEATEVTITVELTGTSNDDIHIGLDKSMGTAKPGDDFTVMAEDVPFVIEAGMMSAMKMVTITPVNDEEIEGEEEILVQAWAMTEEGVQIGEKVHQGIVLTDDDSIIDLPLIALSVDNTMFVEGVDQTLTITATANGTVPVPQIVVLAPVIIDPTTGQTVTTIDPEDAPALFAKFATPPGVTITILPNQLTGQMVIPISTVDDMVFEGDEIATVIGSVHGTESLTNPIQIVLSDNDAPTVSLSTSSATLSETGGAQQVTFTADMTSGPVESPTMIHLTAVDGTATGADYNSAGGQIVIPPGMVSGSGNVTINVVEDDAYEPSNETIIVSAGYRTHLGLANVPLTIEDDFAVPSVVSAMPGITLEAGESWTGDVASSFNGRALTYTAASSGNAADAQISGSSLEITGNRKGAANVTVTATNAAGNASFEMAVSVTAIAAEKMVYTDILAAMGRNVMSSVSQTIGGRFSVGAAERQIALANRRVDGMASGMETLINLSGMQETNKYGITDENSGRYNRQRVSERELLQGSSFYYAFDDTPDNHMDAGLSFTIWGAGDWNAFEGAPTASSSYDGTLTSGYVGVDVSKTASWIAGVAVGRTMGSADYDVSVTDGTLETTLNSVYPYVHWTGPGCCIEVWAVGGFGTGEAEANEMTSDLSMSLGMVGLRAQLVGGASGSLDLDLIGDAGITKLTTGEGSASLDDLEASVQRARIGLEASRTSDMGNGMLVTPFAQIAGRYDGGDGQSGNGLEVAGGLRISGGRAGLEARGRYLAIHTGEEVKEQGVSVVAYVRPMGAGGQGLSMSLAPRMGADTEMSNNMWREDSRSDVRLSSRSGAAVKAEIGYGLVHPMMSSLLVTPFGTMDMAGDDQRRMRLGARFGSIGDSTSVLSFELAGERIQRSGSTADHRIGLLGRMSF